MKKINSTCIHEAGHAVVGFHLGIELIKIALVTDESNPMAGYCRAATSAIDHPEYPTYLMAGFIANYLAEEYEVSDSEASIIHNLAEAWETNYGTMELDYHDYQKLCARNGWKPSGRMRINKSIKKAFRLLKDKWQTVELLANDLERDREINLSEWVHNFF